MAKPVRVLSIGQLYPPHYFGGYELTWRGVVNHLRGQGHAVRVLATDFRLPLVADAGEDPDVHRELRSYWQDHEFPRLGFRGRLALERHNAAVLDRHLRETGAEVVNWWLGGGTSLALIERVRRAGLEAVGVIGDDWMRYGPGTDAWTRMLSRRRVAGALVERVTGIPTSARLGEAATWLFNSESVRRRALEARPELRETGVVHPGIDEQLFRPAPKRAWRWKALYLGRIDPRKGIDTAVEALIHLPAAATLDVVGSGDERHARDLRALVERQGLDARVSFRRVEREKVPNVYAEADVVVFPVRWHEPWGLVPLEAMAVGRPVVATGTGGSAEYLRHDRNCLLFQPDRPQALATAIRRLAGEPDLRAALREGGFATAARFAESAFNRDVAAAILAKAQR